MVESAGVGYVTLRDAAKVAGIGYSTMERWIGVGVRGLGPLASDRIGHVRVVRRTDLESYVVEVAKHSDGRSTRHKADKA